MKKYRLLFPILFLIAFAAFLIQLIKGNTVAILNPQGIIADQERVLIFTEVSIMLTCVFVVIALVYFFALRYRVGSKARYEPNDTGKHGILGELIWWIIPAVIVGILAMFNWRATHALDPYKTLKSANAPLTIQVVALNWKWLFIYPAQHIATVNFIEFPEQTPLNFELTADAPMNSFWIPQLGGQMYAMAGMSTQLHLMASQRGEFSGSAAEINGEGFSGMKFMAKSVSQADFNTWVASVKKSGSMLTLSEYNKLSQPSKNNPVTLYSSVDGNLYNTIMMKFSPPSSQPSDQSMSGMHM